MSQTEFRPQPKWWGYVKANKRYLMRYHHCMAIFSGKELLYTFSETITDKKGVAFAIKHFESTTLNS